jgi:SAM-dependent methyltransferase
MQWFEDDALWEGLYPFLFSPERLAGTPAEIDQLTSLLALVPGARILDVGCGPGRHTLELARRGFAVTGVDRTKPYLERARGAAAQEKLAVELVEADMREFQRPEAFDAAISMLSSFGYFEEPADDLRVLRNIHQSLKPGGSLLIDVVGTEVVARIFQARDWQEGPDGSLMLQDRRVSDDWSRMHQRWIVIQKNERHEFRFHHRVYSGQELAALARQAGFDNVKLLGNLAGSPYDVLAQRLVVISKKQT